MGIQWTRHIHSVVITRQSNQPVSKFNRLCNEITSVWSMFPCNKHTYTRNLLVTLFFVIELCKRAYPSNRLTVEVVFLLR